MNYNPNPDTLVKYRVEVSKFSPETGWIYRNDVVDRSTVRFCNAFPEMENIVGSEDDLAEDFANDIDYLVRFVIYEKSQYGEEIDIASAEWWASDYYNGTTVNEYELIDGCEYFVLGYDLESEGVEYGIEIDNDGKPRVVVSDAQDRMEVESIAAAIAECQRLIEVWKYERNR